MSNYWSDPVSNRCHDRAFLLRFARDRDTCRSMLRDRLHRYRAAVEHRLGEPERIPRKACWRSLAVGDADVLDEAEARMENGARGSTEPVRGGRPGGGWILKKEPASYA